MDEPKKRRRTWLLWSGVALMVLPASYILSFGPVQYFALTGQLNPAVFRLYEPLVLAREAFWPFAELLDTYLSFWVPPFDQVPSALP